MTRAAEKITIEDELRDYCGRVRRERRKKFDRRDKLEAPPACRIELPTYREAVLKRIDFQDLGDHQSDPLVQDSEGKVFLVRTPDAAVLDPIEPADIGPHDLPNLVVGGNYFVARPQNADSAHHAVWIRTSGEKAVLKFGRVSVEVDVVEFAPFQAGKQSLSEVARLADEAWSLFRADVLDRAGPLFGDISLGSGDEPLTDNDVGRLRDRLLEAGIQMPAPYDPGYEKTWAFDQKVDALLRNGEKLLVAVRKVMVDDTLEDAELVPENGVDGRERAKEATKTYQHRRSRRFGRQRHPIEPKIQKGAEWQLFVPHFDEILKDAWHLARLEAGVKAARYYIDKIKNSVRDELDNASRSQSDHAPNVGKTNDYVDLENQLARYSAVDDDAISVVLHWEPAWLQAMLSGQPREILILVEDIISSAGRLAGRSAT